MFLFRFPFSFSCPRVGRVGELDVAGVTDRGRLLFELEAEAGVEAAVSFSRCLAFAKSWIRRELSGHGKGTHLVSDSTLRV